MDRPQRLLYRLVAEMAIFRQPCEDGSSGRSLRNVLPCPMMKDLPFRLRARSHFSSFIFLQTSLVWPVFESITVVTSRQLQVTVLAFSCLTTTQCSMSSAVGGGIWLRIGSGVGATGCFFAAQPNRSRQNTSQAFLIPFVLARWCLLVDDNLGYTPHANGAQAVAPIRGMLNIPDGYRSSDTGETEL